MNKEKKTKKIKVTNKLKTEIKKDNINYIDISKGWPNCIKWDDDITDYNKNKDEKDNINYIDVSNGWPDYINWD